MSVVREPIRTLSSASMFKRILLSGAVVCALLAAVVFAPMGGDSLWIRTLHNYAHAPIFGAIALAVLIAARSMPMLGTRPRWQLYALAFGTAGFLGALTELAQVPTGRDASWEDLVNDLLGAASFLALFAAFEARRGRARAGALLVGVLVLGIASWPLVSTANAYARRASGFPAIADFTRGVGVGFISTRFTQIAVEPVPREWAASAERALRIDFFPGSWPGIEFTEPPPDWRGYRTLTVEVINPSDVELIFAVRIDDREHNGRHADRYNQAFNVAPRTREKFEIPLAAIESAPRERKFDLAQVKRIIIFRRQESSAPRMYLVSVRLGK